VPNKHLSQPPTELVLSRLQVFLETVNSMYTNKGSVTQDDLLFAYQEAMALFIKSLDGSIVGKAMEIKEGMPANPVVYNTFTDAISKDLSALFLEIGAIDRSVAASFNSIVAYREQALNLARQTAGKIGDYLLYADPSLGAGFFFGDSFTTAERIDVKSDFLERDECFFCQDEGIVLLPLDGDPTRPKIKSYIINEPSNGVLGNNSQVDAFGHDSLDALGDGNPDTWVEYEKVTVNEASTPLVLDLTLVLDSPSVINHININPINFGTFSPVRIVALETSENGTEYVSVKDETPIGDFISEEEEDVFTLSPATSKFAGQGFFSFLPRKTKYVHIVLEQHDPYSIQTMSGTRLRYGIGIRDINLYSRKFKPKGGLVSRAFSTSSEIRKVSVWASENPIEESVLADVTHEISYNDGANWLPIQPQRRAGTEIPEIVNFNNTASNSVSTDKPVDTLRHRIRMERFPDAFDGEVTLKQERIQKVDIVNIPTGGDPSIELTNEPVTGTLGLALPFWGSYSYPRARSGTAGLSALMDLDSVEFTVESSGETGTLRYPLPYVGYRDLEHHIRVFLDGEQWEYCPKGSSTQLNAGCQTSYSSIDEESKVYFLNRNGTELQFGHNDGSARGMVPSSGTQIKVCLDGDNPTIELTEQGFVMNLENPSDGDKSKVKIISFKEANYSGAKDFKILLPKGKTSSAVFDAVKSEIASTVKLASSGSGSAASIKSPVASTAKLAKSTYVPRKTKENLYKFVEETDELPPFFQPPDDGTFGADTCNFRIEEYETGTDTLIETAQFTTPVEYVDGDTELRDGGVLQADRYSFDWRTGNIYLGEAPYLNRDTYFVCKMIEADRLTPDKWDYYKHPVTGKMDTGRIILDPSVVHVIQDEYTVTVSSEDINFIQLISGNTIAHSWFNRMIVKGTIKFSADLLGSGVEPMEVPYVDGKSELLVLNTAKERIPEDDSPTGNIYTYTVTGLTADRELVGSPSFDVVKTTRTIDVPDNQFVTQVDPDDFGAASSDGDWCIDGDTVSVYVDNAANTPLNSHIITFSYRDLGSGLDFEGLYSVDYEANTIYFATGPVNDGYIYFDTTAYSAFYNIAEIVSEGDIEEVDEANKKVTLSTSLAMRFLKQPVAEKARPQFMKAFYEYYKKTTQSLKDIEPYFSPMCKDIAFRAVTVNLLEEL